MSGDCIPYQPIISGEAFLGLRLFATFDDGDHNKVYVLFQETSSNSVHEIVRLRTTLQTETVLPPKI